MALWLFLVTQGVIMFFGLRYYQLWWLEGLQGLFILNLVFSSLSLMGK